jgi:hypothetical protein
MADEIRPTNYGARRELSAEQIGTAVLGISRSLISEAERLRSDAIEDLLQKHFEPIIQSMKGGFEDLLIHQKEHEVSLREQRAQFTATDTNVNTTLSAIRLLIEGQTRILQESVNSHVTKLGRAERRLVLSGLAMVAINILIVGGFILYFGRRIQLW